MGNNIIRTSKTQTYNPPTPPIYKKPGRMGPKKVEHKKPPNDDAIEAALESLKEGKYVPLPVLKKLGLEDHFIPLNKTPSGDTVQAAKDKRRLSTNRTKMVKKQIPGEIS